MSLKEIERELNDYAYAEDESLANAAKMLLSMSELETKERLQLHLLLKIYVRLDDILHWVIGLGEDVSKLIPKRKPKTRVKSHKGKAMSRT